MLMLIARWAALLTVAAAMAADAGGGDTGGGDGSGGNTSDKRSHACGTPPHEPTDCSCEGSGGAADGVAAQGTHGDDDGGGGNTSGDDGGGGNTSGDDGGGGDTSGGDGGGGDTLERPARARMQHAPSRARWLQLRGKRRRRYEQ